MNSKKTLKQNKISAVAMVLSLLLVLSVFAALLFGGTKLTLSQTFGGLFGTQPKEIVVIIRNIRLPRAVAARPRGGASLR